MLRPTGIGRMIAPLILMGIATAAWAAEPNSGRVAQHITLRNGFDLICDHRDANGSRIRLYLDAAGTSYLEVDAADIAAEETVTLPAEPVTSAGTAASPAEADVAPQKLSEEQLHPLLAKAGEKYDIDTDLLASVVRQESDGQPHAVSRAGAQGLMQLMPGTASEMGVADSFAPGENINGGSAYLDWLLKRYHDNLQLALAAYNAGPAAVDHWHGIPPYRETRVYVARVIHEYNRRYELRHRAQVRSATELATLAR
jgi:soluble lytic murein transglycosylase-like protein